MLTPIPLMPNKVTIIEVNTANNAQVEIKQSSPDNLQETTKCTKCTTNCGGGLKSLGSFLKFCLVRIKKLQLFYK